MAATKVGQMADLWVASMAGQRAAQKVDSRVDCLAAM